MTEMLIAAHVSKYKHLSNFESLKEFNNHYSQFMTFFKDQLTKADIEVVKLLKNFGALVPGVTNISANKLSKQSKENGQVGFCAKTAKRTLNKLEELGFGEKRRSKRWNGSDSSNVFIFNRIEVVMARAKARAAKHAVQKLLQPRESAVDKVKSFVASKKAKVKEERKATLDIPLDPKYTDKKVPEEFRDLVKSYYCDALKIEEFWNRIEIAGKKTKFTDTHRLEEFGIEAFKELIKAIKSKKNVRDEMAYFYGTVENKLKADIRSRKKFLQIFRVPRYSEPKVENESVDDFSMDEFLKLDGANVT